MKVKGVAQWQAIFFMCGLGSFYYGVVAAKPAVLTDRAVVFYTFTTILGLVGLVGLTGTFLYQMRHGFRPESDDPDEPSARNEDPADGSGPALSGTAAGRVAPRRPSSPEAERRRIELTRTASREPARTPLSTRFTGRGRETDLREQLRFAAARCEFDAAGLQARFGGGTSRALPWSQLAEVRARTLPSDPPWESALIVDFVPVAGEGRATEPIRLLPATTMSFRNLPGGAASSRKENLRRLAVFALAQNPAAAVEPASAGFFREGKDCPRFASMAQFNEYDAGVVVDQPVRLMPPARNSRPAPGEPVPGSGRWVLVLAAVGLVVAFVAIPRVLFRRTVWAINGLDVPLTVTVAGKSMQVPAHQYASVKTAADVLEFVATTQSGHEVDRAKYKPISRGSNVAFNVLGAAPLFVRNFVYAPQDRQGPFVGSGAPDEAIEMRQVLERTDIDYFLDPPPPTIQVDAKKRGVLARRQLSVTGDWRTTVRSLASDRQAARALKLAEAVAAAEPDEPDPKDAVRALTPRPRGEEAPAETPPHPGESFLAVSADRRARAEQTPLGEGQCTVTCKLSGQVVWTVHECLTKLGEHAFTTPDCERLMVVRSFGEASAVWRQSPVVFIYHRGQLERHIAAGRFISEDAGVHPMETYFLWMKGAARLSADGAAVEFQTRDGRPQRVPFAPEGGQ